MQIFFSDLETLTGNSIDYKRQGHTDIVYYAIYDINKKLINDGFRADELYNWLKSQKYSCIIYFHNLSYDGVFISNLLYRKNWTYKNTCDWDLATDYNFTVMKTNNKIYKIIIKINNIVITILCTLLLLSNSVDSLGKAIGIEKKDDFINEYGYEKFLDDASYNLDRNPLHKKYYIEYCRRDILIVIQAYKNFITTLEKSGLMSYKYQGTNRTVKITDIITVGQLMKKLAINYICNNGFIKNKLFIRFEKYREYRKFLKGGLTQFNIDYLNEYITEKIQVIDITSSYPASMTELLPVSELLDEKPDGDYIEWVIVDIKYGKIKPEWEHIPCLKCNIVGDATRYFGRNKFIYPDKYYYTADEWRIIKGMYNVNCVEQFYYTRAEPFLKSFIEKLFELKNNATSDAETWTYKICLNALYGKMLQDPDQDNQLFASDDELDELLKVKNFIVDDYPVYVSCQSISTTGAIGNKLNHIKYKIDKQAINSKEINPLIGAYITSKSRINLLNMIKKVDRKNFLYCATDSVFFIKFNGWEKLTTKNKMLGTWNPENDGDAIKILGANRYILWKDGKQVKAGFGGLTNLTDETGERYFRKDKHELIHIDACGFQKKYDDYGIILIRASKTFKNKGQN